MKYCVKYKTGKIRNGTEFFADYDGAVDFAHSISKNGKAIVLSVDGNEITIIGSY